MNNYDYQELQEEMEESFTVNITEEMMEYFSKITGDTNPLHSSGEYAINEGYKDRVVFGMLTASFLSTLAGVYLPGEKSLIHSVDVRMVSPVYIGDKLVVTGKIIEKSVSVPVIVLKVTIKNQDSKLVMRGKMQIGVKG